MKYRETLYKNYHTNQSGRASLTDAKSLFVREKIRFAKEILPIITDLPKDIQIVDMGCGSGSLVSLLVDNNFSEVTGVDLSNEQVELAKQLGVSNVIQGDIIEWLNNQKTKMDLVLGMDIIEHFTKDELVDLLLGVKKHLKPGGKVIFRTPNLDAPLATVFANGDFTHENYMNLSSAEQLMMSVGFNDVKIHSSNMDVNGIFKNLVRKCVWAILKFKLKLTLFATGRSTRGLIFSPNLIIEATL